MTRARSLSLLANSNIFTVDQSNSRVGIGSTIPDVKLDVDGNMNVSGTLTYEDVTNVETAGITTTGGLVVTGLGATIGGITTFFGDLNFGAAGVGGTVTTLGHAEFVGVVTASSFSGDGSGLTGVASTDNINTSTLAQFTGGVGIADSIFHIGDDNTAIRFPGADTFSVETGGTKRFEVDSNGDVVLGFAGNSLYFQNGFNNSNARIQNGGASNNSNLKFYTRSSGTESERLRIASNGSVGFNTTLTTGALTVNIAGDYKTSTQNVADEGLIFQSFTTASTGDVYPGISWSGNPTALGRARASITAIATNDNNGSDLVFLTRNQADGTEIDVTDDEKVRITSSGRLLIATSASQGKWNNSSGDDHIVQIESTSAYSQSWISHSTSSTAGVQLDIGRSRGSSDGDTTVVNNGDLLGHLCFQGADGSQFVRGARISASVNGTPGADDMPTELVFETNSGSSNSSERLRIGPSGQIGLGGANYGSSGQVITSNGSGSAPTWQDASGGISTQAGTASGIVTSLFLNDATDHKVTATGICTITTTQSGTEGQSHTIRIVNSGIATVGFSTYFLFPSGAAPVLPIADGAVSIISFTVHDSVGAGCTQLLAGASLNFS